MDEEYTPLDELQCGAVSTAGRVRLARDGIWLANAHTRVEMTGLERPTDGALVRVRGDFDGDALRVIDTVTVHRPSAPSSFPDDVSETLAAAIDARHRLNQTIREFFEEHGFLEVETPNRVAAPGTDPYLDPLRIDHRSNASDGADDAGYLHTSPEFAMKRLLTEGFERIYQLCKVYRNGESTDLHNPEFTILEWYRAWEDVDTIIDDVERLTRRLLSGEAMLPARSIDLQTPYRRMTMRELIDEACGFDLFENLDTDSLRETCLRRDLLSKRSVRDARWDELFFELMVTQVDATLSKLGAVFVTEWPAALAVLARRKASDPRVAERFELYVGGVELANGFQELTDPDEQEQRFRQDLRTRGALGLDQLPIPEAFLGALRYGMPPSSGVALGVDRLLMLQTGAASIREVAPFAHGGG